LIVRDRRVIYVIEAEIEDQDKRRPEKCEDRTGQENRREGEVRGEVPREVQREVEDGEAAGNA
jgi:hypothetical protein